MSTIDLSHMSDAQLGAMVRASLLASTAKAVPAGRAKVAKATAAKAAKAKKLAVADAAERASGSYQLPGYTVGDIEIPTLDMRAEVLTETAPAKVRSPYNKALFRTGAAILTREATWAELAETHRRLVPTQPSPTEASTPTVQLAVELDANAVLSQIQALMSVLGIDQDAAIAKLIEIGV